MNLINKSELFTIVESLVNQIDLISESDTNNLDVIKEKLFTVYESFVTYKKNNFYFNNEDKILIEELDMMFSQYDYL